MSEIKIESSRFLQIVGRQKARALTSLEEINCPNGYVEIVRRAFDYLRDDLIKESLQG